MKKSKGNGDTGRKLVRGTLSGSEEKLEETKEESRRAWQFQ